MREKMTENTKIYIIKYINYHGDDFTEYYLHPENALNQLMRLMEEAKRFSEFECDSIYSFSYFNPNINSDSTCIEMSESVLKNLFADVDL
jgi:hypothetical protein